MNNSTLPKFYCTNCNSILNYKHNANINIGYNLLCSKHITGNCKYFTFISIDKDCKIKSYSFFKENLKIFSHSQLKFTEVCDMNYKEIMWLDYYIQINNQDNLINVFNRLKKLIPFS